jgi:hypothetical protein
MTNKICESGKIFEVEPQNAGMTHMASSNGDFSDTACVGTCRGINTVKTLTTRF